MPKWKLRTSVYCLLITQLLIIQPAFSADTKTQTLNNTLSETALMHQQGAKSQSTILKNKDTTHKLLAEFQALNHELDQLKINQAHLLQTQSQQTLTISSLQKQLSEVETTEKSITPHLLSMIDWLDNFIAEDIPFHIKERQKSIDYLKSSMVDPEISLPERYRRVLEAFQIESEYGYSIEAYPQTIETLNKPLHVTLLRVGRVGLYYQSEDGQRNGFWNHKKDTWEIGQKGIEDEIKQGLLIAQKQRPHSFLTLPVVK